MTAPRLITAQHFLSDEIVASKVSAGDFEVTISPAFEINGEAFQVVLDGNHSLAAALETGAAPILIEATATDHDAVALIERGEIEDFLQALWIDGEYIDAHSRVAVW